MLHDAANRANQGLDTQLSTPNHSGKIFSFNLPVIDFQLPPELEASEPPEARGLNRDHVKLLVSDMPNHLTAHTQFRYLLNFLNPGDLIVINTSKTRNAAVNVRRQGGKLLEMHLSTQLPSKMWVVELRLPFDEGAHPFYSAAAGERLELPGGAWADLVAPYGNHHQLPDFQRLWIADIQFFMPPDTYLEQHGFPIRYEHVRKSWPINNYQTVYATEVGSAESPSAGRAFSTELITQLVAKGVQFAPLILHTGVSSFENGEPPYDEYYRVPLETARLINTAHSHGKRVIAVGTTVIRAVESVTDRHHRTHPGEGWTDLVITPDRGIFAFDGLLTGFHEPKSSHLAMLSAFIPLEQLQMIYREAIDHRYLWHEFGDIHLMIRH